MSYEKQNFVSGQILKADHLNYMEDGIVAALASSSGLSDIEKSLILSLFKNTLAYITNFKWFINTGTWPSGLVPIVFSAASSVSGTNYKVVNAYIPNQCGVQFSDQDLSKSISTFVGVVSYAENTPSSKL